MNIRMSDREGLAALVLRLRADGIADTDLITALEKTPRGFFVPPIHVDAAYTPQSIPIECGEVMEGVDLCVRMLHLLDLKPGQRVLEIGTGSGFTAAVMAHLVERVLTVDRYRTLANLANQRLAHLGLSNVVVANGDGQDWSRQQGSFDRILVTSAFEEMPRSFAERLVSGGRMITAIGEAGRPQMLVQLTKIGSRFEREDLFPVRFQPIHKGVAAIL